MFSSLAYLYLSSFDGLSFCTCLPLFLRSSLTDVDSGRTDSGSSGRDSASDADSRDMVNADGRTEGPDSVC